MQHLDLTFGDQVVPLHYGHDCLAEICEKLAALEADRFLIVTDERVRSLYGAELAVALKRLAPSLMLIAAPGEGSKNLETLLSHAERAVAWGATRRSVLVTLGGGVPGNLGGLLAALLFRGIRLVHIPTTLIGAMDSVISLKQAVNSRLGKNLFGTFYPPTAVMTDTCVFQTLPAREVRAGICEIIKNALAIHPHTVEQLHDLLTPDCDYDAQTFQVLMRLSIAAKLHVMSDDKFEKGRGLILEYGHTIGHAIELAHFQNEGADSISHGEAVGVGMIAAAHLAREVCGLDEFSVALHHKLLSRAGAIRRLPEGVTPQQVLNLVRFDNKRGYQKRATGTIDMILLRRLGEPYGRRELPLTPVPLERIEAVLESLSRVASESERRLPAWSAA